MNYKCKSCGGKIEVSPVRRRPECVGCGEDYIEATETFYSWWFQKLAKERGVEFPGSAAIQVMPRSCQAFDRRELRILQDRAETMARAVSDKDWRDAFLRLAAAANILDAFIARSSIPRSAVSDDVIAKQMGDAIDTLDKDPD